MSLDSLTLQFFLTVAETGSFTKAANRVGRTQSAISQQMAKLESILGKQLFDRGKTLNLTPAGTLFLGYARQIFALQSEALDLFNDPQLEGDVSFGLPEDFASVFLNDVLAEFSRTHPRIHLSIECDLTLNLFEKFKQKKFDLVLVKMNRPEDIPNSQDVRSVPLCWAGDGRMVEKGKPIPLVLSPHPCVYRTRALSALDHAGLTWRLVFSSPSYAGTLAAVSAGMGITVLPQPMIPESLETVSSRELPSLSATHVSLLKHRSDNPAVNSLEEFVLSKLQV